MYSFCSLVRCSRQRHHGSAPAVQTASQHHEVAQDHRIARSTLQHAISIGLCCSCDYPLPPVHETGTTGGSRSRNLSRCMRSTKLRMDWTDWMESKEEAEKGRTFGPHRPLEEPAVVRTSHPLSASLAISTYGTLQRTLLFSQYGIPSPLTPSRAQTPGLPCSRRRRQVIVGHSARAVHRKSGPHVGCTFPAGNSA